MWVKCKNNHIVWTWDGRCGVCGSREVEKVRNLDEVVRIEGKRMRIRDIPNFYREKYGNPDKYFIER